MVYLSYPDSRWSGFFIIQEPSDSLIVAVSVLMPMPAKPPSLPFDVGDFSTSSQSLTIGKITLQAYGSPSVIESQLLASIDLSNKTPAQLDQILAYVILKCRWNNALEFDQIQQLPIDAVEQVSKFFWNEISRWQPAKDVEKQAKAVEKTRKKKQSALTGNTSTGVSGKRTPRRRVSVTPDSDGNLSA